eukprot:jgi/Orpsp1_1/1178236/evm.model.c7180000064532.1
MNCSELRNCSMKLTSILKSDGGSLDGHLTDGNSFGQYSLHGDDGGDGNLNTSFKVEAIVTFFNILCSL